MNDNRGLLDDGLSGIQTWQKSPFIQGLLSGVKGAIFGAGAGSAVNALRGKSVGAGALVGGIGAGLISGLIRAASQEIENTNQEAAMQYHLNRIGDREPMFFMPPPRVIGPLLHRLHQRAHQEMRE